MPNGFENIMSALEGRGGFFESPQTALELSQIAQTAQRRQQQQDTLDLLTGILEAQTTQEIRKKQATEPKARATELLRTKQLTPVTGRAGRGAELKPVTLPADQEALAQLQFILGLEAPATGRTAAQPPLTAALGQADEIRKILRPLVVEFGTLRPNDPRRKEIISEAQDLFTNAQRLSQGIDLISPGLGSIIIMRPLQELFGTIGLREPAARAGGPQPPAGEQQPPAGGPKPGPATIPGRVHPNIEPGSLEELIFILNRFGLFEPPVGP